MSIKNSSQYYESLKSLHPTAHILGEKVTAPYTHPLIKHMVAGVARTYDLANDPQGREYLVAPSELVGENVSRFIKFYESRDDLLAKVRMLKFLSQNIGTCFMRCTGMDAINAVMVSKPTTAIRNTAPTTTSASPSSSSTCSATSTLCSAG